MKKILFVTSNPGKLEEAREFFEPIGFAVENAELELTEIQSTQEEIARRKALEARKFIDEPLVIEDTGFYIDVFKGFPGPFAAPVIRQIGPSGFLQLMRGVENRKAHFKTIVTYLPASSNEPLLFTGECYGYIGEKETQSHPKLLFDAIFVPNEESRTFGEMTIIEKNKYSHRRKAFEALAGYLKQL